MGMEIEELRENLKSKIETLDRLSKEETDLYKVGKIIGMKDGFEYVIGVTEPVKVTKTMMAMVIGALIVGSTLGGCILENCYMYH